MAILRLYADLSRLRVIRDFVAEASRDLDVEEWIIPDVQLAVDEICSNVITHGYQGQGGQIEVTVEPIEGGVQVIVRDWGKAFDPQAVAVPKVDAPLEVRSLGGLGLFLVRQLMDDVRFEFDGERGNSVTMVKRIRQEGGGNEHNGHPGRG
jgi:serine/threonine-protein kinase RsbW